MSPTHRDRVRSHSPGVLSVLTVVTLLTACAGPGASTEEEGAAAETSSQRPKERYGSDPMGVAQQWARQPSFRTSSRAARRVETWTSPTVLRLVRRTPTEYRAVVASSDAKEAEAVELTIERREGKWRVTEVGSSDGGYLWPRM